MGVTMAGMAGLGKRLLGPSGIARGLGVAASSRALPGWAAMGGAGKFGSAMMEGISAWSKPSLMGTVGFGIGAYRGYKRGDDALGITKSGLSSGLAMHTIPLVAGAAYGLGNPHRGKMNVAGLKGMFQNVGTAKPGSVVPRFRDPVYFT